jgi:hypothetical protein
MMVANRREFLGRTGLARPVSVTLVGSTGDQFGLMSRFQKASHWPFSLR